MPITTARERALALLAASPEGCTEPVLRITHGIHTAVVAAMVEDGLASAVQERVRAGGRLFEVIRVSITAAGRKALGR
jgi:hypothetical protein